MLGLVFYSATSVEYNISKRADISEEIKKIMLSYCIVGMQLFSPALYISVF